ncbi:hypothetical protein EON65_25320 [archaeon]|nr:MAG: hypothetical protein EON65_25320 [archaeon]
MAYPGRGDDMWQQHGDRFIESIRNTFAELRLIHIAFGALYVANKIYNLEDWRRALQTRQIGVMSLGERQSLCIAKCITRKLLCHTEKPCLVRFCCFLLINMILCLSSDVFLLQLLLDEATSALDEESEDIEYQAIQQHFACYISIGMTIYPVYIVYFPFV